jgi:tryptophanyl-tRNA synthetase
LPPGRPPISLRRSRTYALSADISKSAGDTEQRSEERKRIPTGVRPDGATAYVGALGNWIRLQDDECFFPLADYRVADYADRREGITPDWPAVSLDPPRNHVVVQSHVPEHAELAQRMSWYLPLAGPQRNPRFKSELADLEQQTVPVVFFTYPVLQRDRRPTLPRDRRLLVGRVPRLVDLDGHSPMSKSRVTAIYLNDDSEAMSKRVMRMFTDPTRLRAPDPGHVEREPGVRVPRCISIRTGPRDHELKLPRNLGDGGPRRSQASAGRPRFTAYSTRSANDVTTSRPSRPRPGNPGGRLARARFASRQWQASRRPPD